MEWSIELTPKADRQLDQLDHQVAQQLSRFLFERVALLDNPRSIGDALKGTELGDLWKYRVGDYRIIASIEDKLVRILVVRIGNRREVYRLRSIRPCLHAKISAGNSRPGSGS
jgi:mRNA interferase RelE/StbE